MSFIEYTAIIANTATLVTLLILLIWTVVHLFGGDGNEDGHNRWVNEEGRWDFDLRPEERDAVKVLYDLIILIIASGALFGPLCKGWDFGNGVYHKVNVGVISGSTRIVACMFFTSFWYMLNLDQRDDVNANMNYNNYNYQNWEMNEEERLNYHRSVIAYVSLALAILMAIISVLVSNEGAALPEINPAMIHANTQAGGMQQTQEMEVARHAANAAHLDMLSNTWHLLSASTLIVFGSLLIATFVALGGEEADRMKDEGQIFNLIAILLWILIVAGGMFFTGHQVLGGNKWGGSMRAGLLTGTTMTFAGLLFMVFLLYSGPVFEERRMEDGPATALALSISCFFLSLFHVVFAFGTIKYRSSITGAIPVQMEENYDDDVGHDFVRVDGPEMEMA